MSPTCYLARYATNRGYKLLQACWGDIPLKEGETVLEEKLFRGLRCPRTKAAGHNQRDQPAHSLPGLSKRPATAQGLLLPSYFRKWRA